MSVSMLFSALFDRYGRSILNFEEAARELGYKSLVTAYSARRRKKFPIRVLDVGGRLSCTVADLAEFLATGQPQTDRESEPLKKKPGRPTNAERARRAAMEGGV